MTELTEQDVGKIYKLWNIDKTFFNYSQVYKVDNSYVWELHEVYGLSKHIRPVALCNVYLIDECPPEELEIAIERINEKKVELL